MYEKMVKRAQEIDWFARCGEITAVVAGEWRLRQVALEEASERICGDVWFDLIQAALGDLQGFVFERERDQHRRWNEYNDEARTALKSTFERGRRALTQTGIPRRRLL